jgi:hypothetical protein
MYTCIVYVAYIYKAVATISMHNKTTEMLFQCDHIVQIFDHMGNCFSLIITEVAPIFGLLFSTVHKSSVHINFNKKNRLMIFTNHLVNLVLI